MVSMIDICKKICMNKSEYCFLCLRTADVRNLITSKSLYELISYLNSKSYQSIDRESSLSWRNKSKFKLHTVCIVCEARVVTALKVLTLMKFSMKGHQLINMIENNKRNLSSVCSSEKEASAARRFTALHVTQTLVVSSIKSTPHVDSGTDDDCIVVNDDDDADDEVKKAVNSISVEDRLSPRQPIKSTDTASDDDTVILKPNNGEAISVKLRNQKKKRRKSDNIVHESQSKFKISTVPIKNLLQNPTESTETFNNLLLMNAEESILPHDTNKIINQRLDSNETPTNPLTNFIDPINQPLLQNVTTLLPNVTSMLPQAHCVPNVDPLPILPGLTQDMAAPVLLPNNMLGENNGVENFVLAINNMHSNNVLLHAVVKGDDGLMYVPTLPAKIVDGKLEMIDNVIVNTNPVIINNINDSHVVVNNYGPKVAIKEPKSGHKRKGLDDKEMAILRRHLYKVAPPGGGPLPAYTGLARRVYEKANKKNNQNAKMKSSNIDWEDKIPMDVITYADATDSSVNPFPPPPPPSQNVNPMGFISHVYSEKEQQDASDTLQSILIESDANATIRNMFSNDVTAKVISID